MDNTIQEFEGLITDLREYKADKKEAQERINAIEDEIEELQKQKGPFEDQIEESDYDINGAIGEILRLIEELTEADEDPAELFRRAFG